MDVEQRGAREWGQRASRIAIIGAGFSGIAVAIQLKKAGIDSFVIYEKGDGFGGCWRHTTYPGVSCDVVSHFYCFSFEPNPNWTRVYAPGHEIWDYLEHCTSKYGIKSHLRANAQINKIEFVENQWVLSGPAGFLDSADIVVSAIGPLHTPLSPDIEGFNRFAGVKFHSAEWRHDHDMRGRSVAVLGTGSSGVQIIPEIAKVAKTLTVFSRTPAWVLPRRDRAYRESERAWFRRFPILLRAHYRILYWQWEARYSYLKKNSWLNRRYSKKLLQYMYAAVQDPELRKSILPNHTLGCKRVLVSSDYLPALQQPNVRLVTEPISRFFENGAILENGNILEFDTLITATGYKAFNISEMIDVIGPDGLKLGEFWKDRYVTHRTTAVPGFPNFFIMLGPNTGLGYSSMTVVIEAQAIYIARCISKFISNRLARMTPRADTAERLNTYIQVSLKKTVLSEQCRSWYKDAMGRVHSIWPNRTTEYRRLLSNPSLQEFDVNPRSEFESADREGCGQKRIG